MADIQVSGVNCRKKQKLDNMCTNSKKKRVTSLISEKVKSLGFVMKRGIFYKEIADGVLSVITFIQLRKKDVMSLILMWGCWSLL